MKGILFRKIDNEEQLVKYHERIPVEYIVQDLVEMPVEVSVFYYRHPAEQKGVVSGFIHKELLQVNGDGKTNLRELIKKHPRAKFRMEEMEHRHGHRFDRMIPRARYFYLSYAGNHNRGAHFTNLHNEIDEDLHKVFDDLSHYTDKFYYGRYDIKTTSIEDLKQGKNFLILEFNGCGAEPNHIYDCGMSIWKAYGVILHHWKMLCTGSAVIITGTVRLTGLSGKAGNTWPMQSGILRCWKSMISVARYKAQGTRYRNKVQGHKFFYTNFTT